MHQIVTIIIIVAVLLIAWYANERFAPDELLKKIVQICIFVAAILLIFYKLLPLAGISF